jgi:hypothetical protein
MNNVCSYITWEQAVIVVIAPKVYLFHYLLWEYHFLFMPV